MAHDAAEEPLQVVAGFVRRPFVADAVPEPIDQLVRLVAEVGVLGAQAVDLAGQVRRRRADLVVEPAVALGDLDVLVDRVRERLEPDHDLLGPLGLTTDGWTGDRLLDLDQRAVQIGPTPRGLGEGGGQLVVVIAHSQNLRGRGPEGQPCRTARPSQGRTLAIPAGRRALEAQAPKQTAEILRPYLPRLTIRWLAEDPDSNYRVVEGSMVFVDISGFTKMSERLARHGKVGAEEVTDVLGAVFAKLLAVAYGEDGSLLKFGGDALLLWFVGDGHAIRAATAAHGMRATLRGIGKLDTTAGKVVLRLSVGVNSGAFHFFLVGESHRELIVTGPAASRTVDMESTATAGEILLSTDTAAELPDTTLGQPKGDGILLRRGPSALSFARDQLEVPIASVDVAGCIPLALREHLLSGFTDPEHRIATVAFVHFDGVDAMTDEQGPDVVAKGLHELVSVAQRAVEEHGVTFLGTDIDHDGGKIILVAGAPLARGDDEGRMLLAVRAILEAQ